MSKRWYEYVEQSQPKQYIMVINHPLRNDPLHNVTTRIQCDVSSLTKDLLKRTPKRVGSSLLSKLRKFDICIDQSIIQFFKKYEGVSEPQVARSISQNIPSNNGLFVSSSMPIRDLDMYSCFSGNTVILGSNRGASGIDGTIATAVGFSKGLAKKTTLLIGDLAFLYDLNSLALIKDLKKPMVIVVLNNNGGGIFSFLPIQKIDQHFEKYFGTPHQLTFHAAAELFDLNYAQPQTIEEFNQTYNIALKGNASTIIEIKTDRASNLKFHNQLQTLIKNNINEILKVNRRGSNNDKKYHTIRKEVSLGNSRKLRRYQIR